jgi:hypothetical protein
MRSLSLIALGATVFSTAESRRWRFAVPFPGNVDPSLPEPVHKAFENMEQKEKLFDTKEVSRRMHKEKIHVEEKKIDPKLPEEDKPAPRIPWML